LRVAGASQLTANPDPSPLEQLSFAGLTREGYGVLSIIGSNVSFAGLTNGSTGIVAPYITVVNDWGTVGADGRITAFTAYVPDINAASATDNVRIISSGTTTLAAPSTVGSLNLQSAGTINPTLDLGGHELGLTTGGIITSTGVGTNVIRNGSLSTPSGEFVVTTYSSGLTINANIVDSGGGTALTKSGTSMLTLTGNNTYTGLTSIMQGTLAVSSDANLGLGTTINFGGGTLLAAGSFMSAKGIDTVSNGGTINTAGFNLEFTGPSSGSLTKTGLGTLTLDNAMTDSLTIQQGLVVLPHGAASSVVNLIGANLQVAGAIEGLTWQPILSTHPISTLDIGGPAAAALTMVQFSLVGGSPVQVNFGLGSTHSDSWSITQSVGFWPTAVGSLQFEFQNLGGLTTGVAYPLISFRSTGFGTPSSSIFAIAPDLVSAGWAGTFSTTATGVSVTFTSVPEPSGLAIICLPAALFAWAARRRTHNATPGR
jgi:autotransporter-associated beta strand protein